MNSKIDNPTFRYNGELSERILSTSGGMVGACATLVGLVKLQETAHCVSHVDEYAAINAVAFVISAFLAYLALRSPHRPKLQERLELVADAMFLFGLTSLAVISIIFAYDII